MRNIAVAVSTFVYSRMLPWYPPALRAEFGENMLDIFAETMDAAWRRGSWRGIAAAWHGVGLDLKDIVVPYRAVRAAPVVFAILVSTVLYGSLLAMIDPNRHCQK